MRRIRAKASGNIRMTELNCPAYKAVPRARSYPFRRSIKTQHEPPRDYLDCVDCIGCIDCIADGESVDL